MSKMEIIALQGGDIERATDWIFSNPEASDSGMDSVASNATSISNDIGLPDGGGSQLRLFLLVYLAADNIDPESKKKNDGIYQLSYDHLVQSKKMMAIIRVGKRRL